MSHSAPITVRPPANRNAAIAGQNVTLLARVSLVAPGTGTPTGTVTFSDNGTTLGTAAIAADGSASLVTQLGLGSHSLTAAYGGGSAFVASQSSPTSVTINPPPPVVISITEQIVVADSPAIVTGNTPTGADIVVSIDADGQHQPEELPTLVRPIIEGRADHVNGSRMLGDFERESLIRHLGVHFFSRLVTILTGQRVTDISSGYRATSAATLRTLLLEQDQFWTSEVTIEALRRKARVVEVPVTFLTRRGGVTKKPKSLRYGWNFTKAIVKTWLR